MKHLFCTNTSIIRAEEFDYLYTYGGEKLRQIETEGTGDSATVEARTYIAGMEFVNDTLESIQHSDGRLVMIKDDTIPHYQYRIADHLGNTVVFFEDKDGDGLILDTNNDSSEVLMKKLYYPFGMDLEGVMPSVTSPLNRYKYNGKELSEETGLYFYGFRMYDASIGRFTGVDPISDQFAHVSVYNYAENEPVQFIDLWGLQRDMPFIGIDKAKMSPKERSNFDKGYRKGFAQGTKTVAVTIGGIYALPEIMAAGPVISTGAGMSWRALVSSGTNAKNLLFTGTRYLYTQGAYATREGARYLFSAKASAIGFGSDFLAQSTFNFIDGNNIFTNYNLISGFTNGVLKNPFSANYIGSQFLLSVDEGFKVADTKGAIANGLIAGKANGLANKFPTLFGTSKVNKPILSGATTTLDYFGNLFGQAAQKTSDEVID